MNLTKLFVKRPVMVLMVIAAVVIFGLIAMTSMEQEATPDMDMPMMIVIATYSGATPEDVEKLVTTTLEGAVSSQSGIDTVYSQSSEGRAIVMLQYEYGTDMDTAYIDLKDSLDRIDNRLPDDVDSPMVLKMSSLMSSSMSLSVSSDTVDNLLTYIEDEIVPEFEKLSSVAQVEIWGGRNEYISVELKEDKMQQYGLTMSAVAGSVANAEFNQPAGDIDYGSQTLALTSSTSYSTVNELKNIPIALSNGSLIRLEDVANVYGAEAKASNISRYNGEETVSLSLTKRQSSSAVTLSDQATAVIEELNALDGNVSIEIMDNESDTIQESINSVFQTLIVAVILSMFILLLFLGDIRGSLIVGSAMPISLLVTFICMFFMGFSLNVITMGAMVIGVGMMVDNSIVVLDSCFKNHSPGQEHTESATKGTKEVLLSISAGTITTVVVFLPLASISGMVGQLFKPLGYTIVFSLLASLLSAMTLVPFFYSRFKPLERRNIPFARFLTRVERRYGNLVGRILKKKKTVIVVTVAIVAVALFSATTLNMELMSATDEGSISLSADGRPGLKLEKMNEISLQLEEMVVAHPDVESYNANISSGSSSISVTLRDDRKMDTADIVEQWRLATKDYVDCDVTVSTSSFMTGSMSSDDVEVSLKGNDYDTIKAFSQEVADVFRAHPDMITVTTSLEDGDPQIEIAVDDVKAASYGMTPSQVASGVYSALKGIDAAEITNDGQDYTVTVEYPKGKYTNFNDVTNMILVSNSGALVPVNEVASFNFSNAAQSISKEDSQYQVTISGTPTSEAKFQAEKEIQADVAQLNFPTGVRQADSSMQRMMNDEFNSIYIAVVIAVLLVFMVMAIQFESLKHAIMVMVCIPMCLIGSFGLLALTGTSISMTSLLGFLILVGTVVNNGILFVDTTNQYRQSMEVETALVLTARTRLRPILMTTLTTVLSMVPLSLGIGTGSEMMQGMGIVVIGGLTASTLLTLLLLPTFYLLIDGNPEKKAKRAEKRRAREEKRRIRYEKKENINITQQ